ncbi:MAG: AMP-binding protein [Pseudomonadota bacterium]|nr:AMP-binding protein [Pseudomonadota bacterium]
MFDLKPLLDQLEVSGNYQISMPEHFNFGFDVIDTRASDGDKTAYIWVDRSATHIEHHSFSDLSKASSRFANLLHGSGVAKGDAAIVVLPRVPAWYEVIIGCIKAGVVAMPGTNLLTAKDIEYRINKSQATTIVVSVEHVAKIDSIRDNCPSLKHFILVAGEESGWINYEKGCAGVSNEVEPAAVCRSRSDDMMMAYFTSGTTSFPKMVPRDHGYALGHAITGRYWMGLREDDVHWTLSDTGWAKAAWGMLFPQWLFGAAVVLYDGDPRFDADIHLRLIRELGVTTFCAPPTVYRLFAQMDVSDYDLSSLRHSMSAGEPLNPLAIKMWKEATGTTVHDGYGQTETVNVVANVPGMEIRPGSMGKPLPGIDVQIVDDDGAVLADDEIGHIAVRLTEPHPPGLFHGYFEDAGTLNRESFRHGWYYSGDTATRDADGYIWFVGRSDDIISSAGYRISPFEVESVLLEHPAVAESAVVASPDELRGEIVQAHIVLAEEYEPSEALKIQIQDFVKETTAPYKYPRDIRFRDALPKNIAGKIRRVELRENH